MSSFFPSQSFVAVELFLSQSLVAIEPFPSQSLVSVEHLPVKVSRRRCRLCCATGLNYWPELLPSKVLMTLNMRPVLNMKVLMMSHLKLRLLRSPLLGRRRAVLIIPHQRSLVMKKRMRLQRLQRSRRPQSLLRLNPKDPKVFLWEICHDQLNRLMCIENFFKDCGEVKDVRFASYRDGMLKGYGHFEFTTSEAAAKVNDFFFVMLFGNLAFY
nr:nucleolin 1 isoform X2 [Ipomoea batatas]